MKRRKAKDSEGVWAALDRKKEETANRALPLGFKTNQARESRSG